MRWSGRVRHRERHRRASCPTGGKMSLGTEGHQILGPAVKPSLRLEACAPKLPFMSSSPGPKRLLLAFLVAPLAAPVAYVLGTLTIGFFTRGTTLKALSALDLVIGVFTL